jgi:hypothetical protein
MVTTKAAMQAAAITRAPIRIHTTSRWDIAVTVARFLAECEWRRLDRSHLLQFALGRKIPLSDTAIVRLQKW